MSKPPYDLNDWPHIVDPHKMYPQSEIDVLRKNIIALECQIGFLKLALKIIRVSAKRVFSCYVISAGTIEFMDKIIESENQSPK